ncbi:hypothetical protein MtrunA17_Chr2g0301861 [Medicago truncatula]|uniref:Uncharacterized protein n=1 Tax=Medicago truncatula TaxID=3880 RepID=A0A396JBR7_MEDTR|nr:hypothetical protein MtrunA17_Chr2g0301861 [Medicago truncatula]
MHNSRICHKPTHNANRISQVRPTTNHSIHDASNPTCIGSTFHQLLLILGLRTLLYGQLCVVTQGSAYGFRV